MAVDDILNRGEKLDIHLTLGSHSLALLDSLADKYRCARGAVVEAMLAEYKDHDLARRVPAPQAGRKRANPGGGRPRAPR